ncbi:hypothetical protein A0V01_04720 (plasmid) [Borrelia hermsii]|uniref:Outer membrane protein n=3 Tax=Borrelia hermsii TaxID=140 RepID=A0AAN0X6E2_BORHE|nr:hypothetical protein A0V01_04720 [Borrelia hermsii]ANA43726.1 hypothetical protein AXX13_A0410 [Borrelia hermsii HS1]UPA08515.1 hypothetical protein bhDAH_001226 [Borrelia hermsii DAH]
MFMVKFRYIVLLFSLFSLFLFFNLGAAPLRPFDFANWNFEQDIEEAYEASYEVVDDVLVNVDDPTKNGKSKKILQRIAELEGYYKCLVNMIRDDLFLQVEDEFLREYGQYFDDDVFTETDNRFKETIEIPMENAFGKYRHRVLSFSNKTWIKNPDYTKLFIKLQLREIDFVESYVKQKLGVKLGVSNGSSSGQRQSSQRQSSQRPPSQRQSSQGSKDRYDFKRGVTRNGYERPESQRQVSERSSDMVRGSDEQAERRPMVGDNDESLGRQRPGGQRPAASQRLRVRPSEARQENSRPRSTTRPSGVKQGNIRPSSTRPSRRRPGSDIRPNFVRPIVRPLGEKPVNFRSGYSDGDN